MPTLHVFRGDHHVHRIATGAPMPGLSRRAVLAALGIVLPTVVSCASDAEASTSPRARAADPTTPAASAPLLGFDGAGAAPGPAPTLPPRPATPSNAELTARFGALRPREWGVGVTGVVTRTGGPSAALTFDACGGPQGAGFDAQLIGTLRTYRVPATLFLNARWVAANRGLAHELAADPLFAIGNHGSRHLPLSVTGRAAYGIPGTASVADAAEEVRSGRDALEQELQRVVPWFRSGTAHLDEVAAQVCRALGAIPVSFSVNADAGATLTPAQVGVQIAGLKAGDIAIGHMNRPGGGTAAGFARTLPDLLARGVRFESLATLIPA